jgi:competence protein CoiA
MLVAHQENGVSVEAFGAVKGNTFICPGCHEPVILKQGHIIVHHFAHHAHTR